MRTSASTTASTTPFLGKRGPNTTPTKVLTVVGRRRQQKSTRRPLYLSPFAEKYVKLLDCVGAVAADNIHFAFFFLLVAKGEKLFPFLAKRMPFFSIGKN